MTASWTFLAAAFACVWSLGAAPAPHPFTPSEDPVAGAHLFQAKGCTQCHAIDGVGGKGGPDLGRVERPRSAYDLAAALWNHLPQMASRIWASLGERAYFTPDEMSDLIVFLASPKPVNPREYAGSGHGFLGAPGDPQRGQHLVTEKGCLGCHSLSGPGGKAAGSLDRLKGLDSPWTIIATMWNHAFLMQLKAEEQRGAWPTLSADEMADLVAFLRVHGYSRDRDH
jgi:mono/diheme cytochrome c family protein